METMDTTMQVADIAKETPVTLGLGSSEHGGKELGLASGLAFDTDMHDQHKILTEEGSPEVSQSRGDVIEGETSYLGGNEKKNAEPQCSGDRTRLGSDTSEPMIVDQEASKGDSNELQASVVANTALVEMETEGEVIPAEEGAAEVDSLVETPVKSADASVGQSPTRQVNPSAERSEGPMIRKDNSGDMTEFPVHEVNPEGAENSVVRSRASSQSAQVIFHHNGITEKIGELAVVEESRKEMNIVRASPSNIAEVVAAGIAAGVAEGMAESIAETIAKEAAAGVGQVSPDGLAIEGGRVARMDIAKAVAEAIAEGVAQEVAQGLADGLAEAAAIAQNLSGVEEHHTDNNQGGVEEYHTDNNQSGVEEHHTDNNEEGNEDGVVCDCGNVAVVRVVGEKSPNRGLRYFMCASQEPSFFKRKGKRKDSDTIGKCKFFRWVDAPRHTKEEKKKEEKEKSQQQEDLSPNYSTRSSAKKVSFSLESPFTHDPSSLSGDDCLAPEMPSPKEGQGKGPVLEVHDTTSDKKRRQSNRQQRGRTNENDESNVNPVGAQSSPAGASPRFTRGYVKKGSTSQDQKSSLLPSMVANERSSEDLEQDIGSARLQAVSDIRSSPDTAKMKLMENQNGQKVKSSADIHLEGMEKGLQSCSSKAIELDHKSRISTGGLAGDSSSSGVVLGQQIIQRGTRSALKKGSLTNKAERTLPRNIADDVNAVGGSSEKALEAQVMSPSGEKKELHFTRSASKKGASEIMVEQSKDVSTANLSTSVLGKRTSDWTDSYVGPELQGPEKAGQLRKRRSVRGENGPSSRYLLGGNVGGRVSGFGSSEKKPLHYIRRSTGQIRGKSSGVTDNTCTFSPLALAGVATALAGHKDQKDGRFRRNGGKVKFSSAEQKSKSLSASSAEKLQLGAGSNKTRGSQATEESPSIETDKRKQSQTRRQQRKLPLSEVYGTVEPVPPVKPTTKSSVHADKDHSPSPSRLSFGKSTSPDIGLEHKEAGPSKSPLKKRKLSRVVSEDNGLPDTHISKRSAAKKGKYGAQLSSGKHNLLSSLLDTPVIFPTVRYAIKLSAEDSHDPDDPWSLDGPWAKKEETGQQLESVMERDGMKGNKEKEKEDVPQLKGDKEEQKEIGGKEGNEEEQKEIGGKEGNEEEQKEIGGKEGNEEEQREIEGKEENEEQQKGIGGKEGNEEEQREIEGKEENEEQQKEIGGKEGNEEEQREIEGKEENEEQQKEIGGKEGNEEEQKEIEGKEENEEQQKEVEGKEGNEEEQREIEGKEENEEHQKGIGGKEGNEEEQREIEGKEENEEQQKEVEGKEGNEKQGQKEIDEQERNEQEQEQMEEEEEIEKQEREKDFKEEEGIEKEELEQELMEEEGTEEQTKEEESPRVMVERTESLFACASGNIADVSVSESTPASCMPEGHMPSPRSVQLDIDKEVEQPFKEDLKDLLAQPNTVIENSSVSLEIQAHELSSYKSNKTLLLKRGDDGFFPNKDDIANHRESSVPFSGDSGVQDANKHQEDISDKSGSKHESAQSRDNAKNHPESSLASKAVPSAEEDSVLLQNVNDLTSKGTGIIVSGEFQTELSGEDALCASMHKIEGSLGSGLHTVSLSLAEEASTFLQRGNTPVSEKLKVDVTGPDQVLGITENSPLLSSAAGGDDATVPDKDDFPALEYGGHVEETTNGQGGQSTDMNHQGDIGLHDKVALTEGNDDILLPAVESGDLAERSLDCSPLPAVKSFESPKVHISTENSPMETDDGLETGVKPSTQDKQIVNSVPSSAIVQGSNLLQSISQFNLLCREKNAPLGNSTVGASDGLLKTTSTDLIKHGQDDFDKCTEYPDHGANVQTIGNVEESLGSQILVVEESTSVENAIVCTPVDPTSNESVIPGEGCELQAAEPATQAVLVVQESLMSNNESTKEGLLVGMEDHGMLNHSDMPLPGEQLPSNNDTLQCEPLEESNRVVKTDIVEESALQGSILLGDVTSECDATEAGKDIDCTYHLPAEDAEVLGDINKSKLAPTQEMHVAAAFQKGNAEETVKLAQAMAEEPAISGNNVAGEPSPNETVGQASTSDLVVERGVLSPASGQETAGDTPQILDSARAPAASENAGFVDSVWRLASGRKTRSVGSIGAPAVTSKRSRSVITSHKGGRFGENRGGFRAQPEAQWVDVPLDWRNEKSTGRIHLLPIAPRKSSDSGTMQVGSRLLQSASIVRGAHEARPRLARGEVDESSIVTEDREKGHSANNRGSTDSYAKEPTEGVNNGQAVLGSPNPAGSGEAVPWLGKRTVTTGAHYLKRGKSAWSSQQLNGQPTSSQVIRKSSGSKAVVDKAIPPADVQLMVGGASEQVDDGVEIVQKRKRGRPRKDSKKTVLKKQAIVQVGFESGENVPENEGVLQEEASHAVSGDKLDAAEGVTEAVHMDEGVTAEKGVKEPNADAVGNEIMEGSILTPSHTEDRDVQLERSASNTEREDGKHGGLSGETDESNRPGEGGDITNAPVGVTETDIIAPLCACKTIPRQAILKTVIRNGDPNQGLRYWSCSNYKVPFTKKQRQSDGIGESCKYFRWLDTPRVTAKEKREARKERYRQVELQRLL